MAMANPLVSVIIPTFNRNNVIHRAIDSILQQTYKNVELIVVDDGSTDNTSDTLASYKDKLTVIHQNNAGPSAARNRGVEASRGQIIAFLDSDDLYMPTKIERQVDIMQKLDKSVPCCLCNAIVHFPDGRKKTSFDLAPIKPSYRVGIWKNVARILSTRFVLFTQSVAVHRKVLTRIGGFDESFSIMEDHALALHLSLVGPWAYIQDPLVIYHADKPEGLSYRARKEKIQLQKVMVRMYSKILHDNRIECPKTRRRIEHNLKNAQRRLHVSQENSEQAIYRMVLSNLRVLERFKKALYHRSPWFPKMDDSPLEDEL
jgi:glycosyltransferase involved in cell wall biosynthesis